MASELDDLSAFAAVARAGGFREAARASRSYASVLSEAVRRLEERTAEREAGMELASALPDGVTLGADKGYDTQAFVEALRSLGVTPHVAQNISGRRSAVPDAIVATPGYAISQQKRKRIEQGFGWAKTIGRVRQVMVRGIKRVDQVFVLTMAAYNLTRMRSLEKIRLQAT